MKKAHFPRDLSEPLEFFRRGESFDRQMAAVSRRAKVLPPGDDIDLDFS
jgi:hypothetical protein